MRKIGKRRQQRALGALGREQTALGGAARFQADASVCPVDAIGSAGAVVGAQGFKLPIGAGDYVNAAFAIHQDGQIAILGSGGAGGGEDLFGMLQESAHEVLIARRASCLRTILSCIF
jgi:hypothetical protein